MNNKIHYDIAKLSNDHHIKKFQCGIEALDLYLKTQAKQDMKRNISSTYALTEADKKNVAGYYTLSSFAIDTSALPDTYLKKLPRYHLLPSILIGRLAVDNQHQGKKIGEHLLIDAFKRSTSISEEIGIYTIIVHAKDESAINFHKHYDFIEFASNKYHLFLPIKTIKALDL